LNPSKNPKEINIIVSKKPIIPIANRKIAIYLNVFIILSFSLKYPEK
jgi:hypothetical protein